MYSQADTQREGIQMDDDDDIEQVNKEVHSSEEGHGNKRRKARDAVLTLLTESECDATQLHDKVKAACGIGSKNTVISAIRDLERLGRVGHREDAGRVYYFIRKTGRDYPVRERSFDSTESYLRDSCLDALNAMQSYSVRSSFYQILSVIGVIKGYERKEHSRFRRPWASNCPAIEKLESEYSDGETFYSIRKAKSEELKAYDKADEYFVTHEIRNENLAFMLGDLYTEVLSKLKNLSR